MSDNAITLVIPHYNRQQELTTCIRSLDRLTIKPRVIVVDDASMILPEVVNFELIALKEHVGTAEAKNIGLSKVTSEFVWFLDSDTEIIHPGMLKYGLDAFSCDRKLGVLGGEIRTINGVRIIKEERITACLLSQDIYYDPDEFPGIYVDSVPTNNFLVRTSLIRQCRGFCPELINGEDKLVALLIRKMGYRNRISPEFAVAHHYVPSSRLSGQKAYDSLIHSTMFIHGALRGLRGFILWPFYVFSYFLGQVYYQRKRNAYLAKHLQKH